MAFRTQPVLVLVTMLSVPLQGAAPVPVLSGFYACEGHGADGESYRGIVEIVRYHDAYRVRWAFSLVDTYTGIGVVSGNVLAVTYSGRRHGIAAYIIGGDGTRLVGTWTVAGAHGRVYSETLTKLTERVRERTDPHPRPRPDRRSRSRGLMAL